MSRGKPTPVRRTFSILAAVSSAEIEPVHMPRLRPTGTAGRSGRRPLAFVAHPCRTR
jgi:hypothetical protein